jgi:hypothetical protein
LYFNYSLPSDATNSYYVPKMFQLTAIIGCIPVHRNQLLHFLCIGMPLMVAGNLHGLHGCDVACSGKGGIEYE